MFLGPVHTQNKKERLRVLIADDVMATRRSTRLMMTLIPEVEVVAIAHNGRQALEMAVRHSPDIALMDVQMPEMDGITAVKEMLFHRPQLACIMISAERDRETLKHAMQAGARDFIIKPYTAEQITEVMARVIAIVRAQKPAEPTTQNLPIPMDADRKAQLQTIAGNYLRARRTDDETIAVLEELATDPLCDQSWLTALSMVYLVRRQWADLKKMAGRLEKLNKATTQLMAMI
ncbi:MAG: response regulator [Chloroflexi bacterium]|nr:response regulator [Chloroflexota bacterium]